MHRRFNRTQRNYIIIGLCAILVIMGVGYAAFQSQLKISGTSNISSNWNIQITNIESVVPSDMGWDYANDGYNITEPTYTPSSATFNAGFKLPNSEIDYVVEITNFGNIEGQVTIGNLSCGDNSAIGCYADAYDKNPLQEESINGFNFDNGFNDYSDIEFSIKPNENHYILVSVYFGDVTEMPEDLDADIKLDLLYQQSGSDAPNGFPSGETALIGNQEVSIISAGNGLYKDEYEPGRLIYRGQEPDNYIEFNDELWRIVAKETDGTYKIIRDEFLEKNVFDEANHRTTANNTYCVNPSSGCGVFAAVSGTFQNQSGSSSGTVTENSSIQELLNGTYYSSLTETAKLQITSHSFNIGAVEHLDKSGSKADSISKNIEGEKMYQWAGNVGLVNVSDFLKASTNPLCTSATHQILEMNQYYLESQCNMNYLESATQYWTINAFGSESGSYIQESDSSSAWTIYDRLTFSKANPNYTIGIRPVVYLKADTNFVSGNGSKSDPFEIE